MLTIKNSLNLKAILLSGQSFRVFEESDKSFTIILKDRVVNIKQNKDFLEIKSNNKEELEKVIFEYFDLNRDYEDINLKLLNADEKFKEVINYSLNYKILKQDTFEMYISYIISQNNTVKNISNSIERISKKFGKRILYNNKVYYLFPTYDELKNVTEEELKECKVGFRSKYIIEALNKSNILNEIGNLCTKDALEKLMKIKGIGIKVASCILLFGYGRFDTFPVDTWVKKYFNINDEKLIKTNIYNKYGEYSGLFIQYIYHYSRNKNKLN